MWSHIAVQSLFQILLLSYLLTVGAKDFSVEEGSTAHYTVIFTTFVFCQVFNEFNARSIGKQFNVFSGLHRNAVFVVIIAFTVAMQYVIVQYGGDFVKVTPLNNDQWFRCVLIASLTIPLGGLMRLTPVTESESDFATPIQNNKQNASSSGKNKKAKLPISNNIEDHSDSGSSAISSFVWILVASGCIAMAWKVFGSSWEEAARTLINTYYYKNK